MAQVAPSCAVRLSCRYRRVGSCAPSPPQSLVRHIGQWYSPALPAPRAHCLSENRSRRLSARHRAVKTAAGACERSEVLTARRCRALQSHAVFRRNAPDKNVKLRLNGLARRYGRTGSARAN